MKIYFNNIDKSFNMIFSNKNIENRPDSISNSLINVKTSFIWVIILSLFMYYIVECYTISGVKLFSETEGPVCLLNFSTTRLLAATTAAKIITQLPY